MSSILEWQAVRVLASVLRMGCPPIIRAHRAPGKQALRRPDPRKVGTFGAARDTTIIRSCQLPVASCQSMNAVTGNWERLPAGREVLADNWELLAERLVVSIPSNRTLRRDIETIFHSGTLAGLSDGQLLERFATRRAGDAE